MTKPTTTYRDSDGRECSLITMCRREPEWAASRIDTLTKALAARTVICDEREADSRRLHQILTLIGDNGCDCECDCDSDGHDADCELCLACRIEKAATHDWPRRQGRGSGSATPSRRTSAKRTRRQRASGHADILAHCLGSARHG